MTRRFALVAASCGLALVAAACVERAPDPLALTPTTEQPPSVSGGDPNIPPIRMEDGHAPHGPPRETAPVVPGQAVVKLAPGIAPATFHATWGTSTILEIEGSSFLLVDLPPGDEWNWTLDFTESGDCQDAEPNYVSETPESQQGTIPILEGGHAFGDVEDQEALTRIGASTAHLTATGASVTIAILDTGIDASHPALASVVSPLSRDFVDDDADANDIADGLDQDADGIVDEGAGHGTHVAGIVHAVAPGATLLAVRVLDSEGNGTSVSVTRGVRWAVQNGADVLNLSLGMYADVHVIKEAIAEAVSYGVVVVTSAGNLGRDDGKHFTARMSEALAIAASDAQDGRAPFSNWGSHIDLSAPGVGILSTFLGGGWAVWSGTSMATPMVAGGAALRLELSPAASPQDVADALADTAAPLQIAGTPWDGKMGAGRLDLAALVSW